MDQYRRQSSRLAAPAARSGGFTLAEMMVSVAIIGLIVGVLLFNHNEFSDVVELSNETEDLALTIREAQVKGLAVKEFSADSVDSNDDDSNKTFQIGYGVHFEKNESSFILFVDDPNKASEEAGNKQYDGTLDCANSEECLEKRTLKEGYQIKFICAVPSESNDAYNQPQCGMNGVDISYTRPRPNADIVFTDPGPRLLGLIGSMDKSIINTNPDWSAVQIVVESEQTGRESYVEISSTGQIETDAFF